MAVSNIEEIKVAVTIAPLTVACVPVVIRALTKLKSILLPAIVASTPALISAGAKKKRIMPPTISIGVFHASNQFITFWIAVPTVCKAPLNQEITLLHVVCNHVEI